MFPGDRTAALVVVGSKKEKNTRNITTKNILILLGILFVKISCISVFKERSLLNHKTMTDMFLVHTCLIF